MAKVVISASNDHAADLRLYTANKTTTGFDVLSSDIAVPGQQYRIDYIIVATSSPQYRITIVWYTCGVIRVTTCSVRSYEQALLVI